MRKKWKGACDQLSYRAYSESRAYALTVRFKSTFLCLGHMRRVPAKVAHLGPHGSRFITGSAAGVLHGLLPCGSVRRGIGAFSFIPC